MNTLLKLAAAAVGAGAAIFTANAVKTGRESLNDEFCDVLIILGGKVEKSEPDGDLLLRIERAAEYLKLHPCCTAIATGGTFRLEQEISEAQCIKQKLVEMGIEENRILLEENATTTYENFQNSKEIIESLNLENPIIGILSNDYHLYRAKMIAEECGIYNPILIGAKSENSVKGYARENVVVYEVWGKKIKNFFSSMKQD